ncbi:MAG: membrane-bound lytic murein transglycosylase C [Sulfurimonas sp.]|jgi:membrane-bound lytic murein transglycosylase C|uniref:transglycosylase SLT domain-containing protein n=1 Tax=Sulfurimonas sp. TaxID=2022749 RepID=UPI0039E53719
MLKIVLSTTLLCSLALALDKVDSIESLKNEFIQYQSSQAIHFKNYEKMHFDAIKQYKKDLSTVWDEPTLTTKNTIVSYAPDKRTRTNIDFKNEEIFIQTFAKTPKEATLKLKLALAKAVTIDTKSLFNNDPLQKKLSTIRKQNKMATSLVNAKPILSPIIFSKPPTKKSVRIYVDKHIKYKNIKVIKSKKVKHSRIYTTRVKMPSNTILKRSKIYYETIKKESRRQNIPMPLVFAVIHSESSFNPLAKSHVPAFGLMQIVAHSAGRDAYKYLYNKNRLVSSSYLYNSKNNIKMGTAYLHILYYKYLKYIKNEDSKLYCTIAAYNTGAGNVAWAFTKNNDVKSAAKIINTMNSNAVYNYLIKNLKYDEPKYYLQKVISRMPIYNRLYGV